jgi:tight adherence protein C
MNSELWVLTSFFGVVMISVSCVGWVMLNRSARNNGSKEDDTSGMVLDDTVLPGSQRLLARTFHAMGESVPRRSSRQTEPLRKKLVMAGYRWPTAVTIFHGIKVAAALGLAGASGWTILFMNGDTESVLLPALSAAGFGYLMPDRLLDRRIASRARKIRSGLCPALDLLVLTVEAGQALDQAMIDVARSLGGAFPELSEEFLFFHLEVRAGKSREEALRSLSDRSPELELRKLVSVLLDGDRYGTSLGPALRTHSRYLRTRIRQSAQERARKLTVKMTIPTFFLIFPAVLVVTLGPAYLQLKESLGKLVNSL